jgi:hypothetical protein
MSAPANVISFPKQPQQRLADLVRQCPALAAVAVYLPPMGHEKRRQCMEALITLFRLRNADPQARFERARPWVGDLEDTEQFIESELSSLRRNRNYRSYYELWSAEVWGRVEDEFVRRQARFYTALYWRLYRLDLLDQAARLNNAEFEVKEPVLAACG